jgi:hypothetical protein
LPEIEKALKAKGIFIPRPKYDGVSTKKVKEDEEGSDDAREPAQKVIASASEHEDVQKSVTAGRLDKFKHRANHEATSEEDN